MAEVFLGLEQSAGSGFIQLFGVLRKIEDRMSLSDYQRYGIVG